MILVKFVLGHHIIICVNIRIIHNVITGVHVTFQCASEKYNRFITNSRAPVSAESKLQDYNKELVTTQQQIAMATEELMRQNDAAQSTRHLTEDDKQGMRRTLTAKIDKVPLCFTIDRFLRLRIHVLPDTSV